MNCNDHIEINDSNKSRNITVIKNNVSCTPCRFNPKKGAGKVREMIVVMIILSNDDFPTKTNPFDQFRSENAPRTVSSSHQRLLTTRELKPNFLSFCSRMF